MKQFPTYVLCLLMLIITASCQKKGGDSPQVIRISDSWIPVRCGETENGWAIVVEFGPDLDATATRSIPCRVQLHRSMEGIGQPPEELLYGWAQIGGDLLYCRFSSPGYDMFLQDTDECHCLLILSRLPGGTTPWPVEGAVYAVQVCYDILSLADQSEHEIDDDCYIFK